VSAVVYEVNLAVEAGVLAAYRAWLADHVAEIVALPGFTGATTWTVSDPPAPEGFVHLCVQYRLDGPDSLEAYLREHAPRLRADGIARFGDRVRATRRVLVEPR
jgi:hypothetical protein